MFGPSLEGQGGMAEVARQILASSAHGADIRYFSTVGGGNRLRKLAHAARTEARFLRELRSPPDLVHLHIGANHLSFVRKQGFAQQARALGIPVVLHLHSSLHHQIRFQTPGISSVAVAMMNNATARIAVSEQTRRDLEPWISCEVLYNPVDPAAFSVPDFDPHLPPTLLFLGHLIEAKGVFDLVSVMPSLLRDHPDLRLILGGVGESERLKRQIYDLGIGHAVELPGWLDGPAKLQWIAQAWAVVLPSRFEGMPICLIEAAAAGRASIASRLHGIPEAVIDGVTGRLHSARSTQELEQAIRELLRPGQAQQWGDAARAHAKKTFDRDRCAAQLGQIWRRCL